MVFFDSLIDEVRNLLLPMEKPSFVFDRSKCWQDVGHNQLVLLRDAAFELDGVGFNLVTSKTLGTDGTVIIGSDLPEIKQNIPFARISLIELDDVADEQAAYNLIRKIEYVKYHYFPDGYMIRTSSQGHKEVVRVAKTAIRQGLSFENIGNSLISKYKENPHVRHVQVLFVTERTADFARLEQIAKKSNEITETLNHVMNSVNFDCSTCNLKPICDEVEGMKELHFKKAAQA